jgi:hypothetical protein
MVKQKGHPHAALDGEEMTPTTPDNGDKTTFAPTGTAREELARFEPSLDKAQRFQRWLSFLCTSMPIWSMAGPPSSLRRLTACSLCGAVYATTLSGGQPLHPI